MFSWLHMLFYFPFKEIGKITQQPFLINSDTASYCLHSLMLNFGPEMYYSKILENESTFLFESMIFKCVGNCID